MESMTRQVLVGAMVAFAALASAAPAAAQSRREMQMMADIRMLQEQTQQLQQQFYTMLTPVIAQVAAEKQVHFIFDAAQSGLVWADPSMNLTADIVKALDAAGSTPKPAAAAPSAISPAVPVQK